MMRRILSLLAALAFSCGAQAQAKPVLIGAAISQTGYLADLAKGMRDALLLWQDEVNAAGGLLGRPVELRLYDDASDALRNTSLYELLVKDDGAELLVGGFGSAATSMGAAVAERNRRVMVNATGTSPSIHKRVYRYLFQVPPQSDKAVLGLLQLAEKSGLRTMMVTARDEKTAEPLLELLRRDASTYKVELRPSLFYSVDTNFGLGPFARKLAPVSPDVLVTPASPRDAADLIRGFKAAGFLPKVFVARGVSDPEFIRQVGMDAEYSMGFSSYEPQQPTAGNAAFVRAYRAKYKVAPDFHAACAWAAGKVIEAAVAKAGSLDQEKLREALLALETDTVLGGYKVAPDGHQVKAESLVVQILKGRREVVWPLAYRTAEPVLPVPGWDRRKPK